MERRTLSRVLGTLVSVAVVAGIVATCSALGGGALGKSGRAATERAAPPDATAPEGAGQRVRVQVLNATTVRGLARRATMFLRDRGFDVVELGTAAEQLDTTVVLDRSNHPEWAQRVARSLGDARVESRSDSSRYLDVTVMLGRSWRLPAEPFYP